MYLQKPSPRKYITPRHSDCQIQWKGPLGCSEPCDTRWHTKVPPLSVGILIFEVPIPLMTPKRGSGTIGFFLTFLAGLPGSATKQNKFE